jgi:deoxyadenosine/deoxycytidine kinase
MTQHKVITIVGNIGSGKSTFASNLVELLPARLVNADPYDVNPFIEMYSSDHARWSLATELFFTLERAKRLEEDLASSDATIRIIDSGLLMGIDVYAKHHLDAGSMTKPEWELFERIANTVISDKVIYPNLAIVLKCSVEKCLERISGRGRGFERDHSYEYLINLERKLETLKVKLVAHGIKIIEVDTENLDYREPEVFRDLIAQIEANL